MTMTRYLSILLLLLAFVVQSAEFKIAKPGFIPVFPRDHGSHPDYRIEWWYLTGHFHSQETQQRFGYQATWFRVAVDPNEPQSAPPTESFKQDQLHLAHMAVLDAETGTFVHEERFQRANWDTHASTTDLDLRNGNWTLKRETSPTEHFQLKGSVKADAWFDFTLTPAKPLVQFGENGISRKGDSPSAASIYLTYPRLELSGQIEIQGKRHTVTGQSWMDHEISSSQLGADQIGWDWASIQLDDGRELMIYLLRKADGTFSQWSRLYWINEDSKTSALESHQFQWKPTKEWTSPETGATYPTHIQLTVPDSKTGKEVTLHLNPLALNQEMIGKLGGINYWEGACDVLDENKNPIGKAYIELTGYDGKLADRLR